MLDRYVTDAEAARLREEAADPDVHQSVRNAINGFDATRTALLEGIEKAEASGWDGQMRDRLRALAAEIRGTK